MGNSAFVGPTRDVKQESIITREEALIIDRRAFTNEEFVVRF
jgi:hypothetical protein